MLHLINLTSVYIIALFTLLKSIVVPLCISIYRHFIRSGKDLRREYGEWAIVTGATDGIGRAYAFELAKKKLNIVLISRTEAKLIALKEELLAKHSSIEVKTFAYDFEIPHEQQNWKKLQQFIESLPTIGLLINNIGASYSFPQYFHELSLEEMQRLIELNVTSTTHMTRFCLPKMVSIKKGAIVNISSISSLICAPLLAEYSASKQYGNKLMENLRFEYGAFPYDGIHFSIQSPFYITSKLSKIRRASLTTPTPEQYAREGVKHIGYELYAQPFFVHSAMEIIFTALPTIIQNYFVRSQHLAIRKAGLKKQQAAKKE
jgi:17beta-estradiol 17-dehydrogenase / very-long-chain 3-oxoacyl-CoA reductase